MVSNTKEKIIYSAFKLFLEKGYEGTNIRDICKEVNIKASSLYFYYESKQELFFYIYDNIWSEKINFLQTIRESLKNTLIENKLQTLFNGRMEYFNRNMIKEKFLLRYYLFPPAEISIQLHQKYKNWVTHENTIFQEVISECFDKNPENDALFNMDYIYRYKKFESTQMIQMSIFNTKADQSELDLLWVRFWNYTLMESH